MLRQVRRFLGAEKLRELTDGQLLERFADIRDELAFTALLNRHGPLVFGVCRRLLSNSHDAEDACQATFLVLLRCADRLDRERSLASWLHTVAYRVALKARASAARRKVIEECHSTSNTTEFSDEPERRDLRQVLDEELNGLPAKYRAALILCALEGKTHQEAARELGFPTGSMSRMIARGHELLRGRLTRRGLTLSAGLLVPLLASNARAVTPALVEGALAILPVNAGRTESLSPQVANLVEGVMRQMFLSKVKTAALVFLVLALIGSGAGWLSAQQQRQEPPPVEKSQTPVGEKPAGIDAAESPIPAGALARLGTSRFRHASIVSGVAMAPDGKTVASGSHQGTIMVWDAVTGKLLRQFKAHTGVTWLTYSHDGKILASSGWYGPIVFWDPETGKQLRTLKGHDSETTQMAFSPDDATLATVGKDGNVCLWDVKTGEQRHRLSGHTGEARAIAFTPNGKSVVSSGIDKTIRVWDVESGKEKRLIEGHENRVDTVAVSPDGKTIASGGRDSTVRLWDIESGKQTRSWKHTGWIECVAFAPDGKSLAVTTGWGNEVYCWDVTGESDRPLWKTRYLHALRLSFSADGKKLAGCNFNNTLRIWDPATGKDTVTGTAPGHEGWVSAVCFCPDQKRLISAGSDCRIIVWDTSAGRETQRLEGHSSWVWCLALSPDGKALASGSDDRTIRLWNLATGKEIQQFKCKGAVKALAFSPDGQRLASAGGEDLYPTWKNASPPETAVWEVSSGKQLFTLVGHESGIKSIDYSPDGKLLATGGNDKSVRIWNADNGKEIRRMNDHTGAVEAVAFSPGGRTLASAGQDGVVRLWKVADGEKVRQFDAPVGWVVRLAFSPDGRTLATTMREVTGQGPAVRLWEVSTGKERRVYAGHQSTAYALAFSGDGRRLASGGADDSVLLWDVTGQAANRPGTPAVSENDLMAAWIDLSGTDGVKAYGALWSLASSPGPTLTLLKGELHPAEAVNTERIKQLIKDLDDDDFAVREKASSELEKLGSGAESELKKVLADGTPSAEVRSRVTILLDRLSGKADSGAKLRRDRAMELLELLGTSDARKFLETLAKGAPEAAQTEEARAALKRLDRK
jgi:RNA polymerase sigma factor (sigma-70 family)